MKWMKSTACNWYAAISCVDVSVDHGNVLIRLIFSNSLIYCCCELLDDENWSENINSLEKISISPDTFAVEK